MEEQKQKEEFTFSKEELDGINADIAKAQELLQGDKPVEKEAPAVDEAAKLREEIKAQVLAEIKAEADKKVLEEAKVQEAQKAQSQKEQLEQQMNDLKAKIDSLQESKGVVQVKSPFTGEEKDFEALIADKDRVKAIDDASREQFFNKRG